MADGVFPMEVVTPEEKLFDGPANAVVLRSSEGQLTVLDGHAPLITDVVPGAVRIDRPEEGPVLMAVHGGYLHVESGPRMDEPDSEDGGGTDAGTRVTLLAGVAELADQIDGPRAEQARSAAEARVEELAGAGRSSDRPAESTEPEDPELVQARAALRRAEVRLEVAGAPADA